jgi:hypothetical protein
VRGTPRCNVWSEGRVDGDCFRRKDFPRGVPKGHCESDQAIYRSGNRILRWIDGMRANSGIAAVDEWLGLLTPVEHLIDHPRMSLHDQKVFACNRSRLSCRMFPHGSGRQVEARIDPRSDNY